MTTPIQITDLLCGNRTVIVLLDSSVLLRSQQQEGQWLCGSCLALNRD